MLENSGKMHASTLEFRFMNHLLNILSGVGQVMNAFGAPVRSYHYPKVGDRAMDTRHIRGDVRVVGSRLTGQTEKALKGSSSGKVNDCAITQ